MGSAPLSDTETIQVTVTEMNVAPVLASIGSKTTGVGVPLTFTATATDADLPANTLSFSLGAGAPAGATIGLVTGVFNWTPPTFGSFSVTVVVTDNGTPSLNDSETVQIQVTQQTVAPTLALIGNKTVNELALLSFTATATDPDIPAQTLTFSLDGGAPLGHRSTRPWESSPGRRTSSRAPAFSRSRYA
jgi:hypothetical protein